MIAWLRDPNDLFDLDSMIQISMPDRERQARLVGGSDGIEQLRRLTFSTENADEVPLPRNKDAEGICT